MNRTNPVFTFIALVFLSASVAANERPSPCESLPSGFPGGAFDETVASFEENPPGSFEKLDSPIGRWTPVEGRTIVDSKHAKTGKQCLQLTGGAKTCVILDVADAVVTSGQLSFWAERWTSRRPFSFRVEKRTSDGWQEVYNGDTEVRVGRAFLNHVKVPLDVNRVKQLRFTCTSPPNTGVLIDDVRIEPLRPQKIIHVENVPFTLPVLAGAEASPLVKLKITTKGSLNPVTLTNVVAKLNSSTDWLPIDSVFVSSRAGKLDEPASELPQKLNREQGSDQNIKASIELGEGENIVWLNGCLKKIADIDQRIGGLVSQVSFSNDRTYRLDQASPSMQRFGIALRKGGDSGVHTYRIPGLVTTTKGTLIGVYDVRRRSGRDLPGDIDVGMSRSLDGGHSWEPMKIIMDMGSDPDWQYDGIGDPAILVDQNTGTIWVAATWSHGNRSWRGSGPGMTAEETGQLMLTRSDDDGVTWSKPINITAQVKQPEWSFLLQGPGKGITMRDGTIVFPAQYQDPPNTTNRQAHRLPHSTIVYSKDHGKTWRAGTAAFDDTTESQVVEIEPGTLMLNCRYNRKTTRVVMTTQDLGRTWQKHSTSERALIEPRACMASLIDVDREVGRNVGGWLLFSNPNSTSGRHHITIKASPDRGMTWPKEHRVLLDEETSAGYSCMTMIDDHTVGILYEGSQAQMTFQRIPLADIIAKKSTQPAPEPPASQNSLILPRVFGNHMVLQADSAIPVWGRANAGSKVSVKLGETVRNTTADESGYWVLRLPSRESSATPEVMTIESDVERIQFSDVVVGEVWLCAGQSNMEWPLGLSANGEVELSNADHSDLRLLHLEGGARGSSGSYDAAELERLVPEDFCEGEWKVASTGSARTFSAVGWYFGRLLQEELNVPVGLICPAVGGTPTEAWIPRAALETDPDLKGLVVGNWLDNERLGEFCRSRGEQNLLEAIQSGERIRGDSFGPNHSFKPGFMWDAGIKPLKPYAIRGVIWYQGESNAENIARVREHESLLPLLVDQWRTRWGQGDFPFVYVQLPALNRPDWPMFRDAQRRLLNQIKNAGMAVTIDKGDSSNVHPALKKPVGERLAKWVLGTTYKKAMIYSGPLLREAKQAGESLVIEFDHVGDGLVSLGNTQLRHFEVCGSDRVFYPASAKISSKCSVTVSSPKVPKPVNARYAWIPFPEPPVNLFNSAGLPASPFTTAESQE